MTADLARARADALDAVAAAGDLDSLKAVEAEVLGKRGPLARAKAGLGALAPEERPAAGRAVNDAMLEVQASFDARRAELAAGARRLQVAAERLDLTEAMGRPRRGHAHLVTQATERLENTFVGLGFQIAEGPEVETDWHNFEALNMPPSHPARSEWDTLWVEHGPPGSTLLRAHTSPVQIRVMQEQPPPIYAIMPGRVFRRDTADATHMPVFHQIEGLVVDRGISSRTWPARSRPSPRRSSVPTSAPGSAPRTSPSPNPRPSSTSAVPTAPGWSSVGAGWSIRTCSRPWGWTRRSGAGSPSVSGSTAWPRSATAWPTCVTCSSTTSASSSSSEGLAVLILLSWLNELAPLGDDVDGIADTMNELGMAVEGITRVGAPIPGVVTAKVLETRRHPEAERVHEVFVDAGDGAPLHVWCGAFNMQAGDVVPLATIGATMPDGRDIGRRKILGIASEGMLCSAAELGFGADAAGILVLPPDTPLGRPVAEALGVTEDVVFDLDLTRNRPDAYGHLGVARDLAARFGVVLHAPSSKLTVDGPDRVATVEILDPVGCGRFVSIVLSGIEVGPSTPAMAERLSRAGMRPINNVVDVSNYVMLELNEPNHAYDLDTLGGGGSASGGPSPARPCSRSTTWSARSLPMIC